MRRPIDPQLADRRRLMLAYCTALSDLKKLYENIYPQRDERINKQIEHCTALKEELWAMRHKEAHLP